MVVSPPVDRRSAREILVRTRYKSRADPVEQTDQKEKSISIVIMDDPKEKKNLGRKKNQKNDLQSPLARRICYNSCTRNRANRPLVWEPLFRPVSNTTDGQTIRIRNMKSEIRARRDCFSRSYPDIRNKRASSTASIEKNQLSI